MDVTWANSESRNTVLDNSLLGLKKNIFFFTYTAISNTCDMLGPERSIPSNLVQKGEEKWGSYKDTDFFLFHILLQNHEWGSRQLSEEMLSMCTTFSPFMLFDHFIDKSCLIWSLSMLIAFGLQFYTDFLFKYLLCDKCSHDTVKIRCSWPSGNAIQSPELKWYLCVPFNIIGTKYFIERK